MPTVNLTPAGGITGGNGATFIIRYLYTICLALDAQTIILGTDRAMSRNGTDYV